MSTFRLGKHAAVHDPRTFRLKRLLLPRELPTIPQAFDLDKSISTSIPLRMFLNDKLGCCVIAARAASTLRFEAVETGALVHISDYAVRKQYLLEGGPSDDGLVMLDSLNSWRKLGWRLGRHRYRIEAYASIKPTDHDDLRAAIYLLGGIYVGLALPSSAADQLQAGEPWSVVTGAIGTKNSWGGHCVSIFSYSKDWVECITWGARQRMTWDFFDRYCDEAYVLVDSLDHWRGTPGIDVARLRGYLTSIEA